MFGDNCATCHGIGGTGGKGYPNLRDDVWLWGGKLEDIQYTITHGVRTGADGARMSQMPAFGRDELLKPGQIDDLTEYVVHLSNRPADAGAPVTMNSAPDRSPKRKPGSASCSGRRSRPDVGSTDSRLRRRSTPTSNGRPDGWPRPLFGRTGSG